MVTRLWGDVLILWFLDLLNFLIDNSIFFPYASLLIGISLPLMFLAFKIMLTQTHIGYN